MVGQKRALTIITSPIINGVLGANSAALLTISEGEFIPETGALSEMVFSGPIIPLESLSYSHNYNEDDQDIGNLIIKNGDVDVLVINGSDYDPSDESDWTYVKREALWQELYSIHVN